jgi:flavoprotein
MYPVTNTNIHARIATIINDLLHTDAIIAAIVPTVAVIIFPVE